MIESGSSTKASLIIALQTEDLPNFTSLLKKTQLDLNKFVDPGGFNIFHDFAKTLMKEVKITPFLNVLLEEFKVRHPPTILREMLNSLTSKEKQTPLHLAVKFNKIVKLNQKLVIEYIKYGSDPTIKDALGHNTLHVAAKSGNVGIFAYLYCNFMTEITQRDLNNSTPLHLAVSEGAENMSIFLISILENLNLKDSQGYTPLHLTVFSSAYKVARHLVMSGADRNVKCNHGLTPFELAKTRGCIDMYKVLKEPGLITNPCRTPIKKIGRKRYSINLIFMFLKAAAVVLFLLPNFGLYFSCGVVFIEIGTIVLLLTVSLMNPGYERKKVPISELYATVKPDYICPYCSSKKISTTVHCHHCKRCVRKYDHHCPWINNCIGQRNQKYFVLYLLFLCLDLSSTVALTVLNYFKMMTAGNPYLRFQFYQNNYVEIGVSGVCVVVIFMVLPLLWIQINNLISKKTTHDRYSYKKDRVFSSLTSTNSILLKDSEDWSYYSKKSENVEEEEVGCCFKVKVPSLNQSSRINEETE